MWNCFLFRTLTYTLLIGSLISFSLPLCMPADHLCLGITHTPNWICWTLKKTCQKLVLTPCSRQQKMKSEEMQLPHTVEHVNRHCAGVDPPCIQCLATLIMSAKIHYQNYHFSSHSWVWIMGNDRSTFQFYYTSYRGRYCENEKERKWNKDSIKTQTLPIKFEVWSTVSYLDENGIKFIIFVMSSVQVD